MTPNPNIRRASLASVLVLALALGGCGIFGGKDKAKTTPTLGQRVPILSKIEAGTKVDDSISLTTVVLPAPEVNADFAQGGGNASKSYGHLALGDAPRKAWTVGIAGSSSKQRLAASPVVGGGKLYVMDTDGTVHAFDAASGKSVWETPVKAEKQNANSTFGGGASYDDGVVYVTNGVGEVAALDAANGAVKWRVKPAGPLRGSPTVAFGQVMAMTQDNQIVTLNAADGVVLWNENASVGQTNVFGVASPAAGQGTIVAGYSSGELVAYRYENGRQLWADALARTSIATSVSTLTDIDADPIIERGRVFALGQGGRMAAYELVTGQRVWELNLAGISTPAIAGDWIFTLTDEAKLLCIAKSNGKVRWMTQLPRYRNEKKKKNQILWTGPVLAGNRLWIANSRGEVMHASVTDGTVSEFTKLGAAVSLAPVVANQTLYILDDNGKITAFR
ncbi:Pyrrolo-quinoline quinone [Novosphingobium aromaticivorans DSM 12444]|uniref:Pyrrolo-quinoline quinone n=1 Tax=Novosphingobium aromaticivorans (strain ATCC 700278 / DSM 12444 / CCUG 56034 / CIP 105152 / NBRC 16084 / F199) TaxID=279238 RepID=Q2G9T4_NOVAD|nr:PQQ-binding-like beta-propeller repeat protein [Novosphingobium aromaticivorans]ABD25389.1 Pyrrolo-quinoline quinone [Novosphingobium aromaticivorans DSM 12444]SCX91952.1 Outer membrane protein assembly factor BamB, contains PQQ-like beta-propeller repeat [Novosphingobium aromaticivorans]